jgi:predicted flap endonuclease-1-like 5' DNA nuclease
MFSVKQQVMLQVTAAAVIVFFLALVGGAEAGAGLVWGLIVALALFLLLRQNIIVGGGGDVMRDLYAESIRPATAFVDGTFGIDRENRGAGAAPTAPQHGMSRPPALEAPREGGADDLKRISGVGPKLEETLNGMGIFHFEQIADWNAEQVAWIDEALTGGFKGRASRDDWVEQARALSSDRQG